MGRWEPDAQGRLREAAMELFAERGFESTTVEDIATRAGLTKRTFFRHFPDKREVLFGGGVPFQEAVVEGVAGAPAALAPLDAAAAGLRAAAGVLPGRALAQRRQRLILANAELQERELVKMASIAAAVTAALREREVAEPAASVTAEAAIAVFRVAYDRWVAAGEERTLPELIDESLGQLRVVAAA